MRDVAQRAVIGLLVSGFVVCTVGKLLEDWSMLWGNVLMAVGLALLAGVLVVLDDERDG